MNAVVGPGLISIFMTCSNVGAIFFALPNYGFVPVGVN